MHRISKVLVKVELGAIGDHTIPHIDTRDSKIKVSWIMLTFVLYSVNSKLERIPIR